MLVADDFHLAPAGPAYRPALVVFLVLCAVLRRPTVTEHKSRFMWVGLELRHGTYQIGISQRRADWFVK